MAFFGSVPGAPCFMQFNLVDANVTQTGKNVAAILEHRDVIMVSSVVSGTGFTRSLLTNMISNSSHVFGAPFTRNF